MAVKGILSTATFKPFSYEEMLAPVLMATEAHLAQEEQYNKLLEEAGKWENRLSTDENDPARKMYNEYMKSLQSATDNLATRGLTLSSRKELSNMRRRYATDIEAIKAADEEYTNMLKERRALKLNDDSIVFDEEYSGISDFLGGKKANNNYVSLNKIMKRTADKALSAGYSIYNELVTAGNTPEEALATIFSGDHPRLQSILNSEIETSGEGKRDETKRMIANAASVGLNAAASSIAEKEYLTKYQREQLERSDRDYRFNVERQRKAEEAQNLKYEEFLFKIESEGFKLVREKGKALRFEINPDHPRWEKQSDGTYKDRWKGVKPGTASSTPTRYDDRSKFLVFNSKGDLIEDLTDANYIGKFENPIKQTYQDYLAYRGGLNLNDPLIKIVDDYAELEGITPEEVFNRHSIVKGKTEKGEYSYKTYRYKTGKSTESATPSFNIPEDAGFPK